MLLNLYTTTYEYDKDSQKKSRQLLRQQLEFEKDIERENELINLYPQMTYQTLEGFGGAVTDSAGYMYAQMSEEQKQQVVQNYFGKAAMKSNQERNHGGKLLPEYRTQWAEYICRYIEEYRKRGYHVKMLTLQNEPKAVQTWDSCIYTAQEQKEFLRDYMWRALCAHGLDDIEIYLWDHNKERVFEWAQTIIDDETTHMVAGMAFHWYSGIILRRCA